MMRRLLRVALSHNRTLAANCRKLASTRTRWAIKAKAIASVFATCAPEVDFDIAWSSNELGRSFAIPLRWSHGYPAGKIVVPLSKLRPWSGSRKTPH